MIIKYKLTFCFALFFAIIVILAYTGNYNFQEIEQQNIINQKVNELIAIQNQMENVISSLVLTTTIEQSEGYRTQYNNLEQRYQHQLAFFDQSLESEVEVHLEQLNNFHIKLRQLSQSLIELHNTKIKANDEFIVEYPKEKQQRYNIRTPLFTLQHPELNIEIGYLQYYSKETLYQHRDQKHLDQWMKIIESVKSKLQNDEIRLPIEQKNYLLQQLNEYQNTAAIMGKIAINNKEAEQKETQLILQTREVINAMEKVRHNIEQEINHESLETINAMSTFSMTTIAITAIISIGLMYLLYNAISKPLEYLTNAARKIGKGGLDTRIQWTSQDEFGELAKTFNQMVHELEETTVSKGVAIEAQKAAEEANYAKSTFLANMSHENCCPLCSGVFRATRRCTGEGIQWIFN